MTNKLFFPVFLFIFCLTSLHAQLKVVPIGRVHVGNEITSNFDLGNLMTMSLFGRGTDTYRVGSKLSFGDVGTVANGGMTAFIGEYGNTDTDQLHMHGKSGIFFTTGSQGDFVVGKFDPNTHNLLLRGTTQTGQTNFSDLKLKKNVVPLGTSSSLAAILKLRGVQFDWKTDKDQEQLAKLASVIPVQQKDIDALAKEKAAVQKRIEESKSRLGFIAQEIQVVLPNLVKESNTLDGESALSVDYFGLLPLLVESIKELQGQVDLLKKEVEKLKKQ
jgi:Chaperone of endosialidase